MSQNYVVVEEQTVQSNVNEETNQENEPTPDTLDNVSTEERPEMVCINISCSL